MKSYIYQKRSIMKTIYLQRKGSSNSYNTNNCINSQLGFYIGVQPITNDKYHVLIASRYNPQEDEEQRKRIEIEVIAPSLPDVFRRIEKEMQEEFSENVTISDTIEMYCHANFTYRKTEDKYLAVCFYEKSTETIRLYPENYCLVSFKRKGTKDYLQMDGATLKFLPILEIQAAEYEKEKNWTCHQDKSEDFLRERFAWLIGEDIKKGNNNVKFCIVDSLIR